MILKTIDQQPTPMKEPIGWGNIIVKLNGYKYSMNLLHWWKTNGKVIHGAKIANDHIDNLQQAINDFVHIHKKYFIEFKLKNSDNTYNILLTKEDGTLGFWINDNERRNVYTSRYTLDKDKRPFKKLSSIIRAIEDVYKDNLEYVEVILNRDYFY